MFEKHPSWGKTHLCDITKGSGYTPNQVSTQAIAFANFRSPLEECPAGCKHGAKDALVFSSFLDNQAHNGAQNERNKLRKAQQ